ncbi:phosphoadenosine phosphosulfate sulfotransferase [Paraeggerthella hongkongensis]|uniref:phosphoadenosine phosphosulfate sulfotransferase n=2 Tax=Coriobacteriia TaxID=84998 RepID=UPI000DF7B5D7|nr:phosphoadenosine phosphosulfate sulfotransferase [Paraeggerthella hongkongensis]
MKTLGSGLKELMASFGAGDDSGARARRAAAVKVMWRKAVEAVYKDAAPMVLDHINAVYVMRADDVDDARAAARVTDGGTVLVVYSDDSMIRSDLDARQEFLKMKLNEQGEHVEAFCIKPSRFDMKSRHPFRPDSADEPGVGASGAPVRPAARRPLAPEETAAVEELVATVDNAAVRRALEKAMIADLQRKTSKDVKNDVQF